MLKHLFFQRSSSYSILLLQFDISIVRGLTIPLSGGQIKGGAGNLSHLTIERDDSMHAQQPTIFIPGGSAGRTLPLDQRVRHMLSLHVGIPSRSEPSDTGAAAAPLGVALFPRPRVEQLKALRYKLQPIGHGSALPIPQRAVAATRQEKVKLKERRHKKRNSSAVSHS